THSINKPLNVIRRKQRRRAAAEVNALNTLPSEIAFPYAQLPDHRLHHLILVFQRCAEMKIAVVTCLLAERDVKIDTCHDMQRYVLFVSCMHDGNLSAIGQPTATLTGLSSHHR